MRKRAWRVLFVFFLSGVFSACATGGLLTAASGQGDLRAMEAALNTGADPNLRK